MKAKKKHLSKNFSIYQRFNCKKSHQIQQTKTTQMHCINKIHKRTIHGLKQKNKQHSHRHHERANGKERERDFPFRQRSESDRLRTLKLRIKGREREREREIDEPRVC